jgi:probable HAF family extracellular repeat protein
MTGLGTLGGLTSSAQSINDAGVVVGYSGAPNGRYHAFRYENGVMSDLNTLGGGNSLADDINSSGVIVGNADTSTFQTHAFVYKDGVMTDLAPFLTPLGITGFSEALGINDRGDIVGEGQDAAGNQIAFLLSIPEPSTVGLFVGGLLAVAPRLSRRRRNREPE